MVRLFSQLEQRLRAGSLSLEEVIRLAMRWSETLPPRRGVVVHLHDIAQQADLAINVPQRRTRPRRRKRRAK